MNFAELKTGELRYQMIGIVGSVSLSPLASPLIATPLTWSGPERSIVGMRVESRRDDDRGMMTWGLRTIAFMLRRNPNPHAPHTRWYAGEYKITICDIRL